MKQLILALCISAVAFPALSIQRYNTLTMTCAQVQDAVNRDGAAILRYPSSRVPSLQLYDRYVRNRLFCGYSQFAKRDYIPTRDSRQCRVLKCADADFDSDFDR